MSVVVSDTSPIRALHHLGLVHLLPELFGEVFIPPAVAAELSSPASGLLKIDVDSLYSIRILAPNDRTRVMELQLTLDDGESEALSLALELHAAAVLIDELQGRATARRLGIPVIGVLGVLIRGKQHGSITQVSPLLNRLRTELNFHISEELFREILMLADEASA